MKVYVDKIPTQSYECLFHTRQMDYWGHTVHCCMFNDNRMCIYDGKYDGNLTECPYLSKAKVVEESK